MPRLVLFFFTAAAFAAAADRCDNARDLRLVNGKIVTMDARNSVVSAVTIQDGRFAPAGQKLSP